MQDAGFLKNKAIQMMNGPVPVINEVALQFLEMDNPVILYKLNVVKSLAGGFWIAERHAFLFQCYIFIWHTYHFALFICNAYVVSTWSCSSYFNSSIFCIYIGKMR